MDLARGTHGRGTTGRSSRPRGVTDAAKGRMLGQHEGSPQTMSDPPAASIRTKQRHAICRIEDLPPGERKIVNLGRGEIGVLNVNGVYYCVRNICPHRGAPLCLGTVTGTMLPSEPGTYRYGLDNLVLRCPWHRWEFDLRSGRARHDPRQRVKVYPVEIEDGMLIVLV